MRIYRKRDTDKNNPRPDQEHENSTAYRQSNRQPVALQRPDCDVRIRLRQPVIGVALIVLLAWLILAPHPLAMTGLVTLGSLMLFSYVWVRSLARARDRAAHAALLGRAGGR